MAQHIRDNERHRIVMTAIIWRENEGGYEYLVTKRSPTKKVFPNKWTVPGGGLEPEDYIDTEKTTDDAWYFVLENALRREVLEEVNVEIGKPQYLLDLVFIRPDDVPVLTLSYYAQYIEGEVELEEGDATEWRWVTADEAHDLDLIPGIEAEIDMVNRVLLGGENVDLKI